MSLSLELVVIAAGCAGFAIAASIHSNKRKEKKLTCPLGSDCDTVVRSDYSRFLHVPVEVLGMAYYACIVVGYAAYAFIPAVQQPATSFVLLAATALATLFSAYLIFIQAAVLRQWCTWCIGSAIACLVIFFASVHAMRWDPIFLLSEYRQAIVTVHAIAAAIGLGGATVADVFFFKFLKDFRFSAWETGILNTLSNVIWFALALLVATGAGLFLQNPDALLASSKFVGKMVVVAVIIINGAFLNIIIAPQLLKFSFLSSRQETGAPRRMRRLAFALGAISITSWYTAFILGTLRGIPISVGVFLACYALLLALAIAGSQVMETAYNKKGRSAAESGTGS